MAKKRATKKPDGDLPIESPEHLTAEAGEACPRCGALPVADGTFACGSVLLAGELHNGPGCTVEPEAAPEAPETPEAAEAATVEPESATVQPEATPEPESATAAPLAFVVVEDGYVCANGMLCPVRAGTVLRDGSHDLEGALEAMHAGKVQLRTLEEADA